MNLLHESHGVLTYMLTEACLVFAVLSSPPFPSFLPLSIFLLLSIVMVNCNSGIERLETNGK